MTDRPATWKVVTVGAAMAGLGILGAGAANAAAAPTAGSDSVIAQSALVDAPADFVALGDDWTDTYWDNGWNNQRWGGDWTDTYWDD